MAHTLLFIYIHSVRSTWGAYVKIVAVENRVRSEFCEHFDLSVFILLEYYYDLKIKKKLKENSVIIFLEKNWSSFSTKINFEF